MTATLDAPPPPRTESRAGWAARNVSGALVTLVLALRLRFGPDLAALAASPRWAVLGTRAAKELCRRQVVFFMLLWAVWSALSFYWSAPVMGALAAVPPAAWLGFRRWWAVYPRTPRARVRSFAADAFGTIIGSYADADGFADFWELRRHLSAHAVRNVAVVTRPSIAAGLPPVPTSAAEVKAAGKGVTAGARARRVLALEGVPARECGTYLGRSAIGPVRGQDCYAAHRDVVTIFGVQQSGKGAWFGGAIIDHPGAVVATSTKLDLYLATALLRGLDDDPAAADARRVWLFNPDALGGLTSTLHWDPLVGCAQAKTARMRAKHLIGVGADSVSDDGVPWGDWTSGVLASLLITAARSRRGMADVAHWAFTQSAGAKEARALLFEAFDGKPPKLVLDAMEQVITTEAKKTRDTIFMLLRNAVGFMADPDAAAACTPAVGEGFDLRTFLARGDALYVVADKTSESAPLRAALLGHIFEGAKAEAAVHDMERLDPPLGMFLDEVALNPVPLPEWVPDAGGRGIHLVSAFQSPSQMVEVWGRDGAAVITDCSNVLMVYGGLKQSDDLAHISDLCGKRHEMTPDPDGDGPGHARFELVPVLPPDGVRRLVEWHPLVIQRNSRPTMLRVQPYWERADVKAAGKVVKPAPGRVERDDDRGGAVVPFPMLERVS